MEHASWIDWRDPRALPSGRIYLGHETCARQLPGVAQASQLARLLADNGNDVTLVTPFLTQSDLKGLLPVIDAFGGVLEQLEVVCSDWGLLRHLTRSGTAVPVIGRLLSAQNSDPCLPRMLAASGSSSREVRHLDGTLCHLKWRPPPPALVRHYRSCWVDKPEVIAFWQGLGVKRCEISNTAQGLSLQSLPGFTYSLHVPWVLVTVMRHCPGLGENMAAPGACAALGACRAEVPWRAPGIPFDLIRRDNALYYSCAQLPPNLPDLPVDRIVAHCPAT